MCVCAGGGVRDLGHRSSLWLRLLMLMKGRTAEQPRQEAGALANVPAGQVLEVKLQLLPPTTLYAPAVQATQLLELLAPAALVDPYSKARR